MIWQAMQKIYLKKIDVLMDFKLSSREFLESDYPTVIALVQSSEDLFFMFPKADFPLTSEQLRGNVENRCDSTVILKDEVVIGFANFYEVEKDSYCSIGNVIIASQVRGQNIGQFLIETMENIASEKYNVSEFRLSCFNTNTRGLLLYNRLGYVPYRIEKREAKDNSPIALIHMKKKL